MREREGYLVSEVTQRIANVMQSLEVRNQRQGGIWAIGRLSWSATGRTGQRLERGKAASIVDLSPFNFCFGRHGRIGRLM